LNRVFIDTNIPIYAGGTPHRFRNSAQRIVLAIAQGKLEAVTNAEVFQEILYRFLHVDAREKGFEIFDQFQRIMAGRILSVEAADVHQARLLAERYPLLNARDLIHLAVMLRHGLKSLISTDTDFDQVAEVDRIDPQDWNS